ncbi:hypothetical protein LLH23_23690 [bacterium]|nr:hypothetical protein [bacterium]
MRPTVVWFGLLAVLLSPFAALSAPTTIADGTPIVLQLPTSLTSGVPKVGTPVPLIVRDTVHDASGQMLVGNGAVASATVTLSRGAKRLLQPGALDFIVKYVSAVDGTRLIVRGMQHKVGTTVRPAARMGIAFFLKPLMLAKGKNVTIPAGLQFPVYVDGDQKLEGASAPDAPLPLVTTDLVSLCAGSDNVTYSFTLTNPNSAHGLRGAAVTAAVLDASGAVIGTSASLDPGDPQQVICALQPGQTRTYVRRVGFQGTYGGTQVHIAQPWEKWTEPQAPPAGVRVLYSEWQGASAIKGMVRNEQQTALRNVQIMVTVRQKGAIGAMGLATLDRLDAATNRDFRVDLVGSTEPGGPYDITVEAQPVPPKP